MSEHENTHEEQPGTVLAWFDSWRLAAGVAFVFLVALLIFDLKLWVDLNNVVDARLKEAAASDQQAVDRCIASATNTPALLHVLDIVERQAMSPEEFTAVRNFKRVSVANAATVKECRVLADKLGVPVPKNIRKEQG